jgi:hippurate hydrolase
MAMVVKGETVDSKSLLAQAQDIQPELVKHRRHLHTIPEFGLQLPQTLAYVTEALKDLGELTIAPEISCAVLHIKGGKPGPTVLLRADMDALAVTEDTGLDFASTNGFMHACGHDLHMAMGIGAAKLLHANKAELAGDVVVFFQSGEEGHGGADLMLERNMHMVSGSLPIAAYGLHVFSAALSRNFASRPGPMMASAGDVIVTFAGKGGHGSMPWGGKDPITPMVQAISAIQQLTTKSFDAFDQVIVNVGWVRAGDTHTTNIVPETAAFGATIRTFSREHFTRIRTELENLMRSIAAGFGVDVNVEFSAASKVVINTPANVDRVKAVVADAFGQERYEHMDQPIPGGEDYASILEVIPGAFVFLGAPDPTAEPQNLHANHSNKAVYDDSVLADGAALLAILAFDALSS